MKPTAVQSFDLLRLAELRDRHQRVLEDYRRASVAVQEAVKSLARLRAEAATHPTAAEILRKPAEELNKFSIEQLTELQISPLAVQQIQAAEVRLSRLIAARDAMKAPLDRSIKFNERLEAFTKAHNL